MQRCNIKMSVRAKPDYQNFVRENLAIKQYIWYMWNTSSIIINLQTIQNIWLYNFDFAMQDLKFLSNATVVNVCAQ